MQHHHKVLAVNLDIMIHYNTVALDSAEEQVAAQKALTLPGVAVVAGVLHPVEHHSMAAEAADHQDLL
jgi:hypothetical protein